MATETISDPVLGDAGRVFGRGERAWASFEREFSLAKSPVSILVNVVQGRVPQHQHDLYREIESWYPQGVHEIHDAILRKVKENPAATELTSLEEIRNRLRLIALNIRYPFRPPGSASWNTSSIPMRPSGLYVLAKTCTSSGAAWVTEEA
jgi:hypothetical protein